LIKKHHYKYIINLQSIIIALLTLCICIIHPANKLLAQNESEEQISIKKHSPRKATLYSTLVPGLGQVYNKKYWKVPIIYGGLYACVSISAFNHQQYTKIRSAYNDLKTTNPNGTIQVGNIIYTLNGLETSRDYYLKNRDLFAIFTVGIYVLNIVDANVDAHLFDFDISDDLSMRFEPTIIPMASKGYASGVLLKFTLK